MKLLKGGRVVDPVERSKRRIRRADGWRSHRQGRPRPAGGRRDDRRGDSERIRRLPRTHRHARASARAGTGTQGNGGHWSSGRRGGRIHGGRLHCCATDGQRQYARSRLDRNVEKCSSSPITTARSAPPEISGQCGPCGRSRWAAPPRHSRRPRSGCCKPSDSGFGVKQIPGDAPKVQKLFAIRTYLGAPTIRQDGRDADSAGDEQVSR